MIMVQAEECKEDSMNKKTSSKKKSGFDAPAIGNVMPKGTVLKRRADGTIYAAKPKKK